MLMPDQDVFSVYESVNGVLYDYGALVLLYRALALRSSFMHCIVSSWHSVMLTLETGISKM